MIGVYNTMTTAVVAIAVSSSQVEYQQYALLPYPIYLFVLLLALHQIRQF